MTWRTLRDGAQVLVVAEEFERDALRLGLLEAGGLERALAVGGGPPGRAPTAILPLAGHSERLHLRRVRHGGWLAGLWGQRVLGPRRAIRELHVGERLRDAGAPVSRPILVAAQRSGVHSPFWSVAVGTAYEEETCDAAAWLAAGPDAPRVAGACRALGAALRHFHDCGGRHPDLHAGNILLREATPAQGAVLVDLDRARVGAPPAPGARMAEIMRLERSLQKRGLSATVGREGCRAFLDAYSGGDEALLGALRARWPRERRRIARHALLWRLGGRG